MTQLEDDDSAVVQKIITELDNALGRDELYSFEVVPVERNFRNKCPVLIVDHTIGLESWCVNKIYTHCYNEIFNNYILKYKARLIKLSSANCQRLVTLLNIALLINPEVSTFWNKRRELVLKNVLNKTAELRYSKIVLSWKEKCNQSFQYRRWLMQEFLKGDEITTTLESNIIRELDICERTAYKSPNNYHSWNYRIWVVRNFCLKPSCDHDLVYLNEYKFSEKYMERNISDYSCFNYRQYSISNVIKVDYSVWDDLEETKITRAKLRKNLAAHLGRILKETGRDLSEETLIAFSAADMVKAMLGKPGTTCICTPNHELICKRTEVLLFELVVNSNMIRFYRNHETLWNHRKYIIEELINVIHQYFNCYRQRGVILKRKCRICKIEPVVAKLNKEYTRMCNTNLFKLVMLHELKFLAEPCNIGLFSERHDKYMKFQVGVNAYDCTNNG